MKLTPTALFHHARSDAGKRHMRYIATSGFGVGMTQILLFLFQHAFNWSGVVSNITAVTLTAVPAFMLNKYWVWGKRGKAHLRKEVLPFWLFTVAGLILSTISVAIVVAITKDPTNPDLVNGNKYAVQAANIVGFGVLWVLKFMFLDRIMFGGDNHTPYDEDMEREEAELDAAAAAAAANEA